MAVASLPSSIDIVDLRQFRAHDFTALFADEEQQWQEQLHWDYRPSAEMLRRHFDAGNLPGYVARVRGEVAGYCFFLYEGTKGLLGDLFVRPSFEQDGAPGESRIARLLLEHALETLLNAPPLTRIEAQPISFGPEPLRTVFLSQGFEVFPRLFLYRTFPADTPHDITPARQDSWEMQPWQHNFEEMAGLIVDAYRDHVDSRLNDQYSDTKGAQRFLQNIVTFPGCGVFQEQFSLRAIEPQTGLLVGALLTSEVAPGVAHITQVCVRRGWQGRGVGRRLLQETLRRMEEAGFRGVSLTVTATNANAVTLYRRLGFHTLKEFDAYAKNLTRTL
jgi:ribosomal protein S18 acetylase RimI-like enzyme